jgi:hypothetical protein
MREEERWAKVEGTVSGRDSLGRVGMQRRGNGESGKRGVGETGRWGIGEMGNRGSDIRAVAPRASPER